jgi:hypothetical protein
MREKREQNLTLPLPEKKDSGRLIEDSFDLPDIEAETEQAINRAGDEVARLAPAIAEKVEKQTECWKEMQERLQDQQQELRDQEQEMKERAEEIQEERQEQAGEIQERQQEMEQRQQEMQQEQEKLRRELSGQWAPI